MLQRLQAAGLRERVARAAAVAPDSVSLRRELLPMLGKALGFPVGVMSTTDPATVLWTSCVLHGVDPEAGRERTLFHNEYVESDVHRIADLARTPNGAASWAALGEAELAESPRVGLLRSMGATDELRVALRSEGAVWGSLIGYAGDRRFDDDDVALAAAIAPALADALRVAMLRQVAAAGVPDGPGIVAVAPDGHTTTHGAVSERWLEELEPHVRRPLLTALIARSKVEPSPHAVAQGRSGHWLRVHLLPAESGHLAIVEPARSVELAWTLAMAYGLTPRERTVVMGVARGLSAKEIAAELAISPWTVHDHVQAALAKVGVDSRQALVAHLFHDQVLPRREQGLHPGPWGWFVETPQS